MSPKDKTRERDRESARPERAQRQEPLVDAVEEAMEDQDIPVETGIPPSEDKR